MRVIITGITLAMLAAGTASADTFESPPPTAMQRNSVALPGALVAQANSTTQPDFSGVWTMDNDRSESAAQGQPIGVVIVAIIQTGSMLQVETTRDGKKEIAIFSISERPSATTEVGGERRAFWDGPALIDEGSVDIEGQTVGFREARMTAADGAEMIVETTLKIEHGYELKGAKTIVTGKNVYLRGRKSS